MDAILLPMKVDCFVFNKEVCNGGKEDAKIAPITQPNYSLLRYENRYLASDVMRHVDLHAASPASTNMRYTDLGTNEPRLNREGVYVHWTLPRPYRTAAAQTQENSTSNLPKTGDSAAGEAGGSERHGDGDNDDNRGGREVGVTGDDPDKPDKPDEPESGSDPTMLTFYDVPPRWLVVRLIESDSVCPEEAKEFMPEICAWVVESDHRRSIDQLDETVDVQVDVSPYVAPDADARGKPVVKDGTMAAQAEIFIGRRFPAATWAEDASAERVRLNLFNSSNQIFADYQPHNGNVFSILDRFEYYDDDGQEMGTLTAAKASYYVVGWQPASGRDLFVPPVEAGKPSAEPFRESRLRALKMHLEPESEESELTKGWKSSASAVRTICHGAMYDVEWDVGKKPPTVPADEVCARLMKEAPIAVGTTPMDAIMAFVVGHSESSKGELHEVEMDLRRLQTFLLDHDDGVEAQRRAANMLSNLSFQRQDGGKKYLLSHPEDDTARREAPGPARPSQLQKTYEPDDEEIALVATMNRQQRRIDAASRLLRKRQWELFASWWELLTDVNAALNAHKYRRRRKEMVDEVVALRSEIEGLEDKLAVKKEKNKEKIQVGTSAPFYQAGDPTVLVAGVQSGWPIDFLDSLKVRLRHQIVGAVDGEGNLADAKLPEYLRDVAEQVSVDEDWQIDVSLLLAEFLELKPKTDVEETSAMPAMYPLYHDSDVRAAAAAASEKPNDEAPGGGEPKATRWRDRWHGTQPWSPLFMEWEVDYFHIDYDRWGLDDGELAGSADEDPKLRYWIKGQQVTEEDLGDHRKLSGRVLMLPQPTVSLKSKILRLFDETPKPLLNDVLAEPDRIFLLDHVDQLAFLSAPLAGFTDHLLTRQNGTHVKPTYRQPAAGAHGTGQLPRAIVEAVAAAAHGAYKDTDLELMGLETDVTPYGTAVQFSKKQDSPVPFKPVTHGQFCFAKLNIVDKFGQAVHAISPNIRDERRPPRVYTSEYLRAQKLMYHPSAPGRPESEADRTTGRGDASEVRSEFVQIPPQINQFARLHAEFVKLHEDAAPSGPASPGQYSWAPVSQWEQPIWGWVMVNYANYGLQFFTSDGSFYREIRHGGPTGSMASPTRLPSQAGPDVENEPSTKQLRRLLDALGEETYLLAFIRMVDGAMRRMLPAPSAFAEFSSALAGQPLALVTMGWSLELAVDAYESYARLGNDTNPPKRLLPDPKDGGRTHDSELYSFRVKLGDEKKAYDGLVGYWEAKKDSQGRSIAVPGDALDLGKLFTYYVDDLSSGAGSSQEDEAGKGPAQKINSTNFPLLKPYYVKPHGRDPGGLQDVPVHLEAADDDYELSHRNRLSVFGAVIDPFTAVHGYSSILPIKELKLLPWMWQKAFAHMTAIFHAGPLVVVEDVIVPPRQKAPVDDDRVVDSAAGAQEKKMIRLPTNSLGQWDWLQPFHREGITFPDSIDVEHFPVGPVDERPRFEDGPYTALEGYLRLKAAVEKGG
ncbi:hypothetical protein Trco_001503 [Trichoderma cornu-damae]|uniref:Uncharacterized protein n=1 Tax=Trichoderma cornu-damae TaxID=654480 RepID=A0A9P8U099_9HYPO|nr:hypothetical protein Trco_001503 [Trichoderma cornu-damae]